jgi:glucose/mannose transport system substrate-binding protein
LKLKIVFKKTYLLVVIKEAYRMKYSKSISFPSARRPLVRAIVGAIAALGAAASAAQSVEVIHWWTSGGETAAVGKFKEALTAKGLEWKDLAVGGADNQRLLLKTRVGKGSPPDAAMINADVRSYAADRNNLANLDSVAQQDKWDSVLPASVLRYAKFGGTSYVAVPVNVHRHNVMWISTAALKKIGADAPPKTWDEFFAMADKAKAAGMIPLAMGEDAWVNFLWYQVAYSIIPPDTYRKAFYEGDEAAMRSPSVIKAFETFRKLRSYSDRSASTRKWNEATQMVMQGRAFAQVMGDWAKGEFVQAGKKANVDYVCAPVPGSAAGHQFGSDSFMFFKHESNSAGQLALARILMDKKAQEEFSLLKGSVPVRIDADLSKFDDCAKQSHADFIAAGKSGTLMPQPAMFQTAARIAAWRDVFVGYWGDEGMTAQQGVDKLVAVTKAN